MMTDNNFDLTNLNLGEKFGFSIVNVFEIEIHYFH